MSQAVLAAACALLHEWQAVKDISMEKFDQKRYINEYNAQHYDKVILRLPKGQREIVKAYASEKGMSLNSYLVALIKEDMEKAR